LVTTLVSPDAKKVLYNEIVNNLLQTSIYDIKTKKTVSLTQSTLTEKCVWSSDSLKIYCAIPQELALAPYPDAWYQGSTSFSDNIWSINPETGSFAVEIALQDQLLTPIDAYNIKVSKDKKYLLFQDKYTLTLWKYTF
jgi:Tol biopolymer transport system component